VGPTWEREQEASPFAYTFCCGERGRRLPPHQHNDRTTVRAYVLTCVCAYVRMCVCAYVRTYAHGVLDSTGFGVAGIPENIEACSSTTMYNAMGTKQRKPHSQQNPLSASFLLPALHMPRNSVLSLEP